MKLPQEYKGYVAELLSYLRWVAGYSNYAMDIEYITNLKARRQGYTVDAEIDVDPVYLRFTISLADRVYYKWKKKEFAYLGDLLVHEICHLYVEPIKVLAFTDASPSQIKQITDSVETQVQMIKMLFEKALPKNYYTPEFVSSWRESVHY